MNVLVICVKECVEEQFLVMIVDQQVMICMVVNDLYCLNQFVMKVVDVGVLVEFVCFVCYYGGEGNWGDFFILVIVIQGC